MQRRHSVLQGGERQPLLIHEWLASSYSSSTLTIPDTGAWGAYDGGNFDFVANSETNITPYDDYIYFDGTSGSLFTMNPSAVEALNLGKSIVVEIDWMAETLASTLFGYLFDFGSLATVAEGKCALATLQTSSFVGFNPKYDSNSWASSAGVSSYISHTSSIMRYTTRCEWDNDGSTINIRYIVNGETLQSYETSLGVDLSWDRFDPDVTVCLGGGSSTFFSYNKPWQFYALRIYNRD